MNEPLATAASLRGVMIQIPGSQLLLPNAVIAEVLSLADSEPVEDAPDMDALASGAEEGRSNLR